MAGKRRQQQQQQDWQRLRRQAVELEPWCLEVRQKWDHAEAQQVRFWIEEALSL
jgi:hypothetical protein